MRFDWVLVGGGLQNCLIVLALLHHRPNARVALIEQANSLGGNHTWSFHENDAPAEAAPWINPLVIAQWTKVDVAFPDLRRTLELGYRTISSTRLAQVVCRRLEQHNSAQLFLGSTAVQIEPNAVVLSDGRRLTGVVVDSRGPTPDGPVGGCGFQKFLGLEVELASPCDLAHPIIMDAAISQTDGYRFFYTLPLADDRLLIEDTYYSDDPSLDLPTLRAGVQQYAESHGWRIADVVREESGVLPIPWSASLPAANDGLLRGGYAGGWFHPTTGYSFPAAVRVAQTLAQSSPHEASAKIARLARSLERQAKFLRVLNWLLFRAFQPQDRWMVLERFHRLPTETIARFYAMKLTAADRARIVCGRPPRGFSFRTLLATRRAS